MNRLIVPDANLFVKILYAEPDSENAKSFFKTCYANDYQLIAPTLLTYEVLKVTHQYSQNVTKAIALLSVYESHYLTLKKPNQSDWLKAAEIVESAHPKSGFPSMYDAIYHAMAIESSGVFVTADRKHYEKTKNFGHIALLSDWQSVII